MRSSSDVSTSGPRARRRRTGAAGVPLLRRARPAHPAARRRRLQLHGARGYATSSRAGRAPTCERVRAAAQSMGELIDALLSLSRMARIDVRLAPVDLSAIARRVTAELREADPTRRRRGRDRGRSRGRRRRRPPRPHPGEPPWERREVHRRPGGGDIEFGQTEQEGCPRVPGPRRRRRLDPPTSTSCPSRSSACTRRRSSRAPASAWPRWPVPWNDWEGHGGPKAKSAPARPSSSRSATGRGPRRRAGLESGMARQPPEEAR